MIRKALMKLHRLGIGVKKVSLKKNLPNWLLGQFQSSWKMLRAALESVPDDRWHDGTNDWHFSHNAYHIVETMNFYIQDSPDKMKWGDRAGYRWKKGIDVEKEILPKITKDLVMVYLGDMEELVTKTLSSMTMENLISTDEFHWFESVFEKLVYLLRHNMHHIGELSKTLRDWDCEHVKWA